MQFAPGSIPIAAKLCMVPKLGHPMIFGKSWFAEFNPQINWSNCSVILNLDRKQYYIIAIYAAS